MNPQEDQTIVACIGIDWADQENLYAIQSIKSNNTECIKVQNRPEAILEWILKLHASFPDGKIAIAIEQTRGTLIHMLMAYDFFVFYLVNPKAFANYRKAFRPSEAKDDFSDAILLLDYVRKHRDQLRIWQPEAPQIRQLSRLVQFRRKLVSRQTALTNQLTSLLKEYFPQAIQWAGTLSNPMASLFLKKWSTLKSIQKSKPEAIATFYRKSGCRDSKLIDQRISEIRSAIAITNDPAIIKPNQLMVESLVLQLKAIAKSIRKFEKQIQSFYSQNPDRPLYESLPGAGDALEPRLAVAFGLDRSRFSSPVEIQQFSGIAPITKRSGKSKQILFRFGCPKFFRQTFHEFAACSIRRCNWAKAYYRMQIDRGKSHHAAVRALAYKWIRILFRCWQNNTPYDDARYLNVLAKRNSPIIAKMVV
jgi:transposase